MGDTSVDALSSSLLGVNLADNNNNSPHQKNINSPHSKRPPRSRRGHIRVRRPKSEKIGEGFLSRPPGTGGAGSQGTGGAGSRGTGGAGSQVPPRGTNPPRQVELKNAVMMLNEMFPPPLAPQYKVTCQSGPPNNPTFTMVCTLTDQSFRGEGRSKKDAKLACSRRALEVMFGHDFNNPDKMSESQNPRTITEIDDWMELEGKNPVSILNELYPGTQYTLMSSQGPSHAPEFILKATLGTLSVEGMGKSKKDAKLHASKALLVHLHKVGFDPATGDLLSGTAGGAGSLAGQSDHAGEHTWADMIGQMVNQKFSEMFCLTTYFRRKVLAGVVMTRDGVSTVVCVSTGTKCINGENLSLAGQSLNDSHAEIISRRSLLVWLYDELLKAETSKEDNVFKPAKDGGFELKPGVRFDLYISTAPCGDSRIFSLHEEPSEEFNLLSGPSGDVGEGSRGKLRSKVESGMGTVPLPLEDHLVQTWDGVIAGERLLTMSCSDKILRWNILGVQGALLSHWTKPIYLSSITIGSRFHPGHMSRAFFDRYSGDSPLPCGYMLNKPLIIATTSPEARQVWKSSDNSVNWILGCGPEILNGSTGKTLAGVPSRLCKSSLAKRFRELGNALHVKPRTQVDMKKPANNKIDSYSKLKMQAKDYQSAKRSMVENLKKAGAGKWIKKPVEQDLFYI